MIDLIGEGEKGRKFQRAMMEDNGMGWGKSASHGNGLWTHSSMTVIARHSTMAGCEAGSRGIGEDAEG
jgi:hypothetical protein